MKDGKSEITGKRYTMTMLFLVAGISSSAYYDKRKSKEFPCKRGPKPIYSDEVILAQIRYEIENCCFHSEGYKKIHARLKKKGFTCGKNRVLNLMQDNNLLAPIRPKSNGSSRPHNGTIITDIPNRMWGTDGKQFYTRKEGLCWLFSVIEHFNDEILGWHTAKIGNRFAALEPVRQAVKQNFGSLDKDVVKDIGLFLRPDHGSQYDSNDFQNEIKYLGLNYSPAFVRSPQCNGIIERFHRTIQEQVFDIYVFEDLEEATKIIGDFIEKYNHEWILHRLNFMSPIEYRNNTQITEKKIA